MPYIITKLISVMIHWQIECAAKLKRCKLLPTEAGYRGEMKAEL